MKLLFEHLFSALLIGCLGWTISGDIYCIPSALFAGWLIDADHLFDFLYYIIRSKKLSLSFVRTGQYFKINNKIIVPLHSWEISILLLLLGIFIPEHRAPFISSAFAHASHLFQDQWTYRVRLHGYSFISRMNCRFKYRGFCGDDNG